jgi:hypothetical protein
MSSGDAGQLSRWWYLDLSADFPELEIRFSSAGGPEWELGLVERGERVMEYEASWIITWIYSKPRDRHWAATGGLFNMVLQAMRDRGLKPGIDPIPEGWMPDARAWDEGVFG